MKDVRVCAARFRAMAEAELAAIPSEMRALLINLAIEVKNEPGPEAAGLDDADELLGLYVGPTREEFRSGSAGGSLPAKVYLYRRNLEDSVDSVKELRQEIRLTLRHELAHHFGFDDDHLQRIWPEGA